jgi:hypothetical protein
VRATLDGELAVDVFQVRLHGLRREFRQRVPAPL